MQKVQIRTAYNYDTKAASKAAALNCKDPSLTVQDQAEDVNDLVRKFGLTGKIPTTMRMPQYGDFTGIGTYQECLQAIKEADSEFLKLPANIREHFKHNPDNLLKFINDPKNAEEGEKLGIWKLRRAQEAAEAVPKAAEGATKVSGKKTEQSDK